MLKEEFKRLFEIRGIAWEGMAKWFAAAAVGFILLIVFVSPWKVLAFFIGCIVMGLVYARPTWAVALLAAYLPFEPFVLKFVPDELFVYAKYFSEGLIYILLFSVLLRRLLEGTKRPSTPLDLPFLLFFLATVASSFANLVPATTAVLGIRQIIRFVVLFFAVAALGPSRAFIRKLVVIMLAVVLFQSALGIIQSAAQGAIDPFLLPSEQHASDQILFTGGTDQFWSPGTRVFATMGRYDQLGTFLCFFMLLIVGWFYELGTTDKRHRLLLGVFTVAAVTLALTYSRASWFGFILGFFWIAVLIKKDKRILYALAAAGIILGAYVFYSGVVVQALVETPNQTLVQRLLEAFSYERYRGEYYGLGRVYWLVTTPAKVVAASPIFGWGPGQYGGGAATALGNTAVYDKLGIPYGVYGTEGYIDNNWFSLWGEVGTLGLALYIWMIVVLWRVAKSVLKHSKDPLLRGIALGYLGCILAVALQAFLGTYLEVRTLAMYFWMFAAILVSSAQREGIPL